MWRKFFSILYLPYKWLIYFPVFIVNTLLSAFLAFTVSVLFGQKAGSFFGRTWSLMVLAFTPAFVRVKGKENIIKGQSYIIVPNHQSMYDIFSLYGRLGVDIRWIMKKELRKVPGVGVASEKVGHIFIDRSNTRAALQSLNEAKQKLINGTSVIIFPEGTRSGDGKLLPFKRGAFKMAFDLQLPILPVTIDGTKNIMPASSPLRILPGKATITIHPAISVSDLEEKDIPELMKKVKKTIESKLIH